MDYELIDAGAGERLERWGSYVVRRPEVLAAGPRDSSERRWREADLVWRANPGERGSWEANTGLPERWVTGFAGLSFYVGPTGQKQMGLFPEQADNWWWIMRQVKKQSTPDRVLRVLNLFAYTGGATVAAACAGAQVCHVDASKRMVEWARHNIALSGHASRVRLIVDDVTKFVLREGRRGRDYDAVIMDPPSFGRGPGGRKWEIGTGLERLVAACAAILSEDPVFFLVSAHSTGLSPSWLKEVLSSGVQHRFGGSTSVHELRLETSLGRKVLHCGTACRWQTGTGAK